jgi:hypothetical protein
MQFTPEQHPSQWHIIQALAERPIIELAPVILMKRVALLQSSPARILEQSRHDLHARRSCAAIRRQPLAWSGDRLNHQRTVPGVGPAMGTILVTEIGDIV